MSLKGLGADGVDSAATKYKTPKDDSPPLLPPTFCFLSYTPLLRTGGKGIALANLSK